MLLDFCIWLEDGLIGSAINDTVWAFAVIESIHLLGLALLGGAVLIVDLRMLGFGLKNQSITELATHARPWLWRAVWLMIGTGTLLFISEAVKCYYNTSFWVKMITLPFAIALTVAVRRRIIREEWIETTLRSRWLALSSITLWFTVAAAGRWIGFS